VGGARGWSLFVIIGQVRERWRRRGEKRERKGKETCVLIHFISRREEGQGMTRKEGRVAVTEDAVVLIYAYYR